MSLATKLRTYRGQSQFKTWLYRITVNAARDLHRKNATSGRLNEAYAELSDLARGEAAEAAKDIAWLYECLERLGESLRETAILVLAEGMSHKAGRRRPGREGIDHLLADARVEEPIEGLCKGRGTGMSDELEKAKRAFKAQEPVRPDDEARRAAIAAAMTRFEEENARAPPKETASANVS